jgi:hypothetical protein
MMASKQQQAEWAKSLEEFLEQGGRVEQIPQGQSGYQEGQTRSAWGAPRKRTASPAADVAAKPRKSKKNSE